jgi:hypothetical protein
VRVSVGHLADLDAWEIAHEEVVLSTPGDVDCWRLLVLTQLATALKGRKVDLLVNLRGFRIDPAVADLYGKVAGELRGRFARSVIRFGPEGDFTASMIRIQGIKNMYPSMIFASREAAAEALRLLRLRAG